MPLTKLQIVAGINREGTNYSNDNGWYQSNNVRFRSGFPEKIGGWTKHDNTTYLGTARALWNWVDFHGDNYLGIGTNLKYYLNFGGALYDITPIRATITSPVTNNCFATTNTSTTVVVTIAAHGATTGDFVTFSGVVGTVGGITAATLNAEYQTTYLTASTFSITVPTAATSTTTGGGTAITAAFQMITGLSTYIVGTGWGAGFWGRGGWGTAYSSGIGEQLMLWSNDNFGQDLVYAVRGGPLYHWDDTTGLSTRGKYLSDVAATQTAVVVSATFTSGVTSINVPFPAGIAGGAFITGTGIPTGTYVAYSYSTGSSTVPLSAATTSGSSGSYTFTYSGGYTPRATNVVMCSAVQQFVIAHGANSYIPGTPTSSFDPMLVRWSDQANLYQWVPDVTNQAGEYRLAHGSFIMAAQVTRQENLIWTDTALYSMQYIGAPYVWGIQLLMDNITIISPNAAITANGATYWMGIDKFYIYEGSVNTLNCTLKQYVFTDINLDQGFQVFAGGNFGYNEIWWYYCSENSNIIDHYVVYNYVEKIWFSGNMTRTAWLDSSLQSAPIAAAYSPLSAFQGYISGTTLTVSSLYYGTVTLGSYITGMGVITGTKVTGYIAASGGVGTYTVNYNQTVSSTSMEMVTTSTGLLLAHETGVDNLSGIATVPIDAYIQSSDIDIEDGQHFGFVWRILPDINFNGSNVNNPYVTMTVWPRRNSGAPYGTADAPTITSGDNYAPPYPPNSSVYIVQQYTGQVYTRLRGRQLSFRVESNSIGTAWQLGRPRIDIKPDGRR